MPLGLRASQKIELIIKFLQQLSALDADNLARRGELGTLSFDSVQDDFAGILAIGAELGVVDMTQEWGRRPRRRFSQLPLNVDDLEIGV